MTTVEVRLEEICPEILRDVQDPGRAGDELARLILEDDRWEQALIQISTPRQYKFLISCREQVISWLDQDPWLRDYYYPLSEKQLMTAYKWR